VAAVLERIISMEKRLLAAVLLSAAVLFGWQFFVARFYPQPPAAVAPESAPAPQQSDVAPIGPEASPPTPQNLAAEPERTIVVETSRWTGRFSTRGAVATSWTLLVGPDNKKILAADYSPLELIPQVVTDHTRLPFGLVVGADFGRLGDGAYRAEVQGAPSPDTISVADGATEELTFVGVDPVSGQQISKVFRFTGGRYDFDIDVIASDAAQPLPLGVIVGPRIGDQSIKVEGGYNATPPHAVVADLSGQAHSIAASDVQDGETKVVEGTPRWAGVTDNYFALAVARAGNDPGNAVITNARLKFDPKDEKAHDFPSVILPIGAGAKLHGFLGPKDHDRLLDISKQAGTSLGVPVDFDGLVNYGMFAFLVRPLVWPIDKSLRITGDITGNYGLAIIVVTALVNLLFFPLRYKSTVSIRKAAKLQPRMKELQAKMKKLKMDDPEYKRLQSEQMDLMRQGNPLGGCLPLLLQLPIFWAFFNYFTTSFVVRQQPFFLWVSDLSSHDPYYVLPVVMCAAQIGSTMLTPMPNSDDPALKMQRTLMTWVMPIVFAVFFFASAPSGLMLYWLTTNVAGIGIQLAINKMLPPDQQDQDGAGVASGKGGASGKGKQRGSGSEPKPELAGSV
jgi:YidC/Oxa1 family membrane protein insertase